MANYFAKLESCLIGMEACASAHFLARKLTAKGHTVILMPPQYVKPYAKTNKNDAADAESICEAVTRSNMRFVPIKMLSNKRSYRFIEFARVSSKLLQRWLTKLEVLWLSLA
jgi:transposase